MSDRVAAGRLRPGPRATPLPPSLRVQDAAGGRGDGGAPPPTVRLFHAPGTPLTVLSHSASLRGAPCPPETFFICIREVHALRRDGQCLLTGAESHAPSLSASHRGGSAPPRPRPLLGPRPGRFSQTQRAGPRSKPL